MESPYRVINYKDNHEPSFILKNIKKVQRLSKVQCKRKIYANK